MKRWPALTIYEFRKRLSPRLVVLRPIAMDFNQKWKRSKLRKDTYCAVMGRRLKKGLAVYRPLTNQSNRAHRISTIGVGRLERGLW